MNIEQKFSKLERTIKSYKKTVIAFSGGVDSTFLSCACYKTLGLEATAVTVDSLFIPRSEIAEAIRLAEIIGVRHRLIKLGKLDSEILANKENRCYLCKRKIFALIKRTAITDNLGEVLEGSNSDDTLDFRPGFLAIEELGVKSPLLEAGLTKGDIRKLSRDMGLDTWDKPAAACLASRVPYHNRITPEALTQIEAAEKYLREKGIRQCRVRHHCDLARIEVAQEERIKFFNIGFMDETARRFRSIGFRYVALDLEGYKTGKLNREKQEDSA